MYKYELSAQLVFILSHQGNVDALTTLSAAVPQSVSYTRHLSVYRGSALSSSLPSNATGETWASVSVPSSTARPARCLPALPSRLLLATLLSRSWDSICASVFIFNTAPAPCPCIRHGMLQLTSLLQTVASIPGVHVNAVCEHSEASSGGSEEEGIRGFLVMVREKHSEEW